MKQGDCLLMDYRTRHCGGANRSSRSRPNLYMVYARRWYSDEHNFERRVPIRIAPEEETRMAEGPRRLLQRAWAHHARSEIFPE